VVAAEAGGIIFAGWLGGYGNTVIIDHGGGYSTLYAHLSRIDVALGAEVARGQVIGRVGTTGFSTGPHLHWEVRVNGEPVEPRQFLVP
jgi:murein DD-endopeptidase MepM/ murein hydrolase activator NlpD